MRLMLERKPEEVLTQAVRGMMPKNKLRNDIISKRLFIFNGPYHDMMPDVLPQFTSREPEDINEEFGFGEVFLRDKHDYKIVAASDVNDLPEELIDLEVDIDESLEEPLPHMFANKEYRNPRGNVHLQAALNRTNRYNQRFNRRYRRTNYK